MREEDIVDPRVVPRWVPVGVSGVPRSREWDAVALVELPELEGWPLEEIAFLKLPDGTTAGFGPDVPSSAVERLTSQLDGLLEFPYEARAARRGPREWSVGARSVSIDVVTLPETLEADALTFAMAPDGSTMLLVDGEEPDSIAGELEIAAAELARHGRERFPAFAVRAERVAPGRWTIAVDPL